MGSLLCLDMFSSLNLEKYYIYCKTSVNLDSGHLGGHFEFVPDCCRVPQCPRGLWMPPYIETGQNTKKKKTELSIFKTLIVESKTKPMQA